MEAKNQAFTFTLSDSFFVTSIMILKKHIL